MEPHLIEFDQTVDDVIAWSRYRAARLPDGRSKPRTRRWALIPFAAFILLGVGLGLFAMTREAFTTGEWGRATLTWIVVVSIVFLLLFRRRISEGSIRRFWRRPENARKLGRSRLEMSREGVNMQSQFAATTWKWDAFDRIQTTSDYVFFVLGSGTAIVIPCSAFLSEEDCREFVRTAKCYQANIERIPDEDPP